MTVKLAVGLVEVVLGVCDVEARRLASRDRDRLVAAV